jgi:hypothetical protein
LIDEQRDFRALKKKQKTRRSAQRRSERPSEIIYLYTWPTLLTTTHTHAQAEQEAA